VARVASVFENWSQEIELPSLPPPRRVPARRLGVLRPIRPFVLVVERADEGRALLGTVAAERGLESVFVQSAEEGLAFLRGLEPRSLAAAVLDLDDDSEAAFCLATEVRVRFPSAGVMLTTSGGSEELAVEALRTGAHDYLHKPFCPDELQLSFTRMMAFRAVARMRPEAAGLAS
jgi:DNA-binding response OmpR family regulator